MKKLLLYLLPSLALSCQSEPMERPEQSGDVKNGPDTFYGCFDASGPSSKTAFSSDRESVVWDGSEIISVFDGRSNNRFTVSKLENEGRYATFSGDCSVAEEYYALYPYQDGATCSNGTFTCTVPSRQSAIARSFDPMAHVSAAKAADKVFYFRNLTGMLSFSFTSAKEIKSVKFIFSGESACGKAECTLQDLEIRKLDENNCEITLEGNMCTGNTYYLSAFGGSYTGLEIRFTASDNSQSVFRNARALELGRSKLMDLGSFNVDKNGWILSRSYHINGQEQMEAFLGDGQSRETVGNLHISGKDITSDQMKRLKNRVETVKGEFHLDGVTSDDYTQNGKGLETEYIFYKEGGVHGWNAIHCEGAIVIENITGFINPNGLGGQKVIGGDFVLRNVNWPFSWNGIDALEEIKGDFIVDHNLASMANFKCPKLKKIGGSLVVNDCDNSLWELKDYPEGLQIGGDLVITENDILFEWPDWRKCLSKIARVGGNVTIFNNKTMKALPETYCRVRDMLDEGRVSSSATFKLGSSTTFVNIADVPPCHIAEMTETTAVRADDFLNSMGVNTAIHARGEWLDKTIECMEYTGLRWIRSGYGGTSAEIERFRTLHNRLGLKFSLMVSLDPDPEKNNSATIGNISKTLEGGRQLHNMGALIAFEGPNEPNNWPIKYNGRYNDGTTWMPVGELMRDLCSAVAADGQLSSYPVWSPSETGAQSDNVGLQFLTIPAGKGCKMPAGTKLADYACCHNYFFHSKWDQGRIHDNQLWMVSSPTDNRCDGLVDNFGKTWAKKHTGYSAEELKTLPRVTTETGCTLDGTFKNWDGTTGTQNMGMNEDLQGKMYMITYLDQFVRGWAYTSIYILRDRGDELSNQTFGFYGCGEWDYSKGGWKYIKRKAADYMHNFTSVLADYHTSDPAGTFGYSIANCPENVHDLLLQKADGRFFLVVWGERFTGGSDKITIWFKQAHKMKVYDPTIGTSPQTSVDNASNSITLTMTDKPLIIEIL